MVGGLLDVPDNMYRTFTGTPMHTQSLSQLNEAALMAMAQQGNPQFNQAAIMEQAVAQQQMQAMATQQNLEVPKVNFYPSQHPDPRKARKKDIKQAYKLLRPTKRSIFDPRRAFFWSNYRYNKDSGTCVVDGCDCKKLIEHDNLYARITDEDTGRSLWDMYWQNPISGETEAFLARTGVTSGRTMRGTYCPEHLHLYHLLCKWEAEQDREDEMTPSRFRDKVKKGVSIVTVPVSAIKSTEQQMPEMVQKYESFFQEIERDANKTGGINIWHVPNPETGLNEITMIQFDMRMFQREAQEQAVAAQQAFNSVLNQQAQTLNPAPVVNTPPPAVVPEAVNTEVPQ
tara:strand:+ start:981 stop:2006 length:1026 start_codon:yes stop_codon:yes gene_type:complete